MQKNAIPVLIAFALGCFSAAPALADDPLTFVTDIRRCTASYSGNGSANTTDSRRVPFGPFEGGADIDITNGLETWFGHSDQVSGMDGRSMTFRGSGHSLIIATPLSEPLVAMAQSKFDIYFTVARPTDYVLEGTLARTGHPISVAQVRLALVATGNPVIEGITAAPDSSETFSRQGTLQPGMYHLLGEATALCRTVTPEIAAQATASCELQFHVSTHRLCHCDWNSDGTVSSDDLFSFLSDFFRFAADYDGDGATNSADLFAFIQEFMTGC